jgi:predicted nucleotidyltransferase
MSLQNRQSIESLLREHREEILDRARRHGARNVRVFGSAVRGEANEDSDIDLLVDVGEKTSPWFPVGLIDELQRLLGRRVDVVTEDSLYWLLRRRILKEAKPL